jgi:phospholipid/cholesterol/gamma-HCH transport system ATP-binding protein
VADASPVLSVRGLRTAFGATVIHDNLDLDVRRGEILCLIGASGSGKSVLLDTLLLLNRPQAGAIEIFGAPLERGNGRAATVLRQRVGVMFQGGALFSSLTALDNILLALREHTRLSDATIRRIGMLKLALVGLGPDAAVRFPAELSGGMIKRVAIARALALDPELVILDEPTAGLDPEAAAGIDELTIELRDNLGLTIIMASHDIDSLRRVPDRIAFLAERRIVALAAPAELVKFPHPDVVDYFDNERAGRLRDDGR